MTYRVLLVSFVFCAYLFGGPQVSKDHQASADASAKARGQTNRVIPPKHVIIDQPYPTISTKVEGPQEQNKPQEKPLPWFVQFTKPEWVIVYITSIYVFIAGWTLIAIKRQADCMSQQTTILQKSVAVAEANADAARENIEMFINKERARIGVELEPLNLEPLPNHRWQRVRYWVDLHGPTEAFLIAADACAYVSNFPVPNDFEVKTAISLP